MAQQGAAIPVSKSDGRATAETVVEDSEDWQMENTGAETAATAAGGAAENGPGAAVDATAGAAAGGRSPRPENWRKITRGQRQRWKQQGGRPRQNADRGGI